MMTNTPTPEAIVKAALERAADCCKVGPSDEWSEETREGYLFSAGECWDNIQRLASDQAEVAQIIQNAGGQTDPNLYAVGYDVGFEDGFKEAQGRVEAKLKKAMEMALEECPYRYGTDSYNEWWNNFRTTLAAVSETHKLKGDSDD